jgi:hypothetical protein
MAALEKDWINLHRLNYGVVLLQVISSCKVWMCKGSYHSYQATNAPHHIKNQWTETYMGES